MFNKRYILLMLGSMVFIIVAFIFLTRELNWNYVSDLYKDKDEPAAIIINEKQVIETAQLHIFVSLNEEQFERLEQLRMSIEDLNPHIEISLTNQYSEQYNYEEWELKSKLDELGDVQLVPNEWILPLATKGLLQPVDRLMNSDSLASHLPGYTDALRWNGYLWGVPYSSNPYIILPHKLLKEFEEEVADVDVNTEPTDGIINNNISEVSTEVEVAINSNWDHMLEMLAKVEANNAEINLLNFADNSYNALLVWLIYGDIATKSGISNNELSEEQQTIVEWLAQHEDRIQLDNAVKEPNEEKPNWPLYYMTSWDELTTSKEELYEQYGDTEVLIPVPWLNGYSFVIQANSKQASAAIEWIEQVTQLASANGSQSQGAPTRNMDFNSGSNSFVTNMGITLNQKLMESQMMNVTPDWPMEYAMMKQRWDAASSFSDKLNLFQ
ncbi:MAG: extracellular solute-binding protein [Candidatus Pristimantibacillus lignocellulolyticus]|uniref:Extracellular solute-binding protein n=1 Tax=Candidatus Pristimantibacillus lignocellulolyticus TaxID=2994561 RepID=A0A9J6ZAF8_9BACL|nr:MAG: extracellular solute-binding protein [Candidatus Pristimantibacillus lignocellulolyticus]